MMHWLSRVVSWLICVLVILASVGLAGALWYAYYSIRHNKSLNTQYSHLEEFLRNQDAVFALAIIATITMVGATSDNCTIIFLNLPILPLQIILLVIIYFLKNKLSGLSALFEEAGVCMMNLPGLLIAPLLAFIVLITFLTFWVVVVICLVTATKPDESPLAPFHGNAGHQPLPANAVLLLNNNTSLTDERSEYSLVNRGGS